MYKWVSLVQLFPEVCKFPSKNLHGLIHIWIVGAPYQMILPFKFFQDVKEIEKFPMGLIKYNNIENIMKLAYRAPNRGGGREIECQ